MSHLAPEELLLDYATGALAEGPALAVALHAALDPQARRAVEGLRAVGAALLEGGDALAADEMAADETSLQQTLARLDGLPVEPAPQPHVRRAGFDWAPAPLTRYLDGKARWKRAFGGFERIDLSMPGDAHHVSLLRLVPGKGLPMHRHAGAEFTVVLQGGYTDSTGSYAAGDFAVGPGAHEHKPIADPGEDCIALIVLERPIVLTGIGGRLLNPLLRWGWL
jgi:putative transcriptional regulator